VRSGAAGHGSSNCWPPGARCAVFASAARPSSRSRASRRCRQHRWTTPPRGAAGPGEAGDWRTPSALCRSGTIWMDRQDREDLQSGFDASSEKSGGPAARAAGGTPRRHPSGGRAGLSLRAAPGVPRLGSGLPGEGLRHGTGGGTSHALTNRIGSFIGSLSLMGARWRRGRNRRDSTRQVRFPLFSVFLGPEL